MNIQKKIELKFPNTLVKSSSKMILNGCRICFYLHYNIFDLLSEDPIDDQLFCDGFLMQLDLFGAWVRVCSSVGLSVAVRPAGAPRCSRSESFSTQMNHPKFCSGSES